MAAMELWTERETVPDPTPDRIHDIIVDLREGEPAVLARGDEFYIQTMRNEHGFLLEKREGGADRHYEGVPGDGRLRHVVTPPWWAFWAKPSAIYYFTPEEIIAAFQEYRLGNADPSFATWNAIRI